MRARLIALLIALALGISLSAALAPDDATLAPTVLPQFDLPRAHFIQYETADRETARVEMLRLELVCADTERCTALALPASEREHPRLEF